MKKDRLINKNVDDYIKWFRAFIEIVNKWEILLEDIYNMDKLGTGLKLIQKSFIINPEEEKDARIFANINRKWVTLIKTINAIGKTLKPFFINKEAHVFRDLIEIMIKSGATLAITYNGWSNNEMALKYLKHFHRHARPIGVFRLLILDGYDSYATFRFKELAHKYKIILLYLSAHITHKLQLLNVGIFSP
jgi:DDE superfamily endonuclease